jgi:hypothetical protein
MVGAVQLVFPADVDPVSHVAVVGLLACDCHLDGTHTPLPDGEESCPGTLFPLPRGESNTGCGNATWANREANERRSSDMSSGRSCWSIKNRLRLTEGEMASSG